MEIQIFDRTTNSDKTSRLRCSIIEKYFSLIFMISAFVFLFEHWIEKYLFSFTESSTTDNYSGTERVNRIMLSNYICAYIIFLFN